MSEKDIDLWRIETTEASFDKGLDFSWELVDAMTVDQRIADIKEKYYSMSDDEITELFDKLLLSSTSIWVTINQDFITSADFKRSLLIVEEICNNWLGEEFYDDLHWN